MLCVILPEWHVVCKTCVSLCFALAVVIWQMTCEFVFCMAVAIWEMFVSVGV